MRNVVFLVKNGIGFGHIRRAILLAEAVREQGRLRPIVVSQASSLQLYTTTTIPVVNFPLLHRVSSAVAEDCYLDILDRLLEHLDPAVVIEDTYPDPRYLALTSLADRPRLLVMRRMDGESFDQIRELGRLAHYDRILIAQRPEEFAREGHSGHSTAAVESSGRFTFVGNLHHTPAPDEIRRARARYAPDGQPLVVVNGGAGGDQMPDGYGDRLFGACATVAARLLKDENPARFVLVTGPYYAGRPLESTPNVTVTRFDPCLAALLAAAQVAVIKPGNNALAEALHGYAHLVLVPDVSFLEGLDEHAARVTADHGGAVATPDADALEPLIRDALKQSPRTRRPAANTIGIPHVVDSIHTLANRGPAHIGHRSLLLTLVPPLGLTAARLCSLLPPALRNAVVVEGVDTPFDASAEATPVASERSARTLCVLTTAPDVPPQTFADTGVRILITPSTRVSASVARWLRLAPANPTLTVMTATRLAAAVGRHEQFGHRTRRLLDAHPANVPCILVDLAALTSESALTAYLDGFAAWLAPQPLELLSPTAVLAVDTRRFLEISL